MTDKQIKDTIEALRANTKRLIEAGPFACQEYLKSLGIPDAHPAIEGNEEDLVGIVKLWDEFACPISSDPKDKTRAIFLHDFSVLMRRVLPLSEKFASLVNKILPQTSAPTPPAQGKEEDRDWEAKEIRRRIDEQKSENSTSALIERAFVMGYFNRPDPPADYVKDIASGHLTEAWERCKPALHLSPTPPAGAEYYDIEAARLFKLIVTPMPEEEKYRIAFRASYINSHKQHREGYVQGAMEEYWYKKDQKRLHEIIAERDGKIKELQENLEREVYTARLIHEKAGEVASSISSIQAERDELLIKVKEQTEWIHSHL